MTRLLLALTGFNFLSQNSHWTTQLYEQDGHYLHDRYKTLGRVSAWWTPMIGPYESKKRETIRMQLKLMKLAGVEGVMLNWYGTQNRNDYPGNLEAADAIINETAAQGMLWSLCYEDRTMDTSKSIADQLVDLENDWVYIRDRYINTHGHVLRENDRGTTGRPVLTNFGPVYLNQTSYWSDMLASVFPVVAERPYLLGVDTGNNALQYCPDGDFLWPGNRLFNPPFGVAETQSWANLWHDKATTNGYYPLMGSAFPRFKDYYGEGRGGDPSTHDSWWGVDLPDLDGQMIQTSMQVAHDRNSHSVQIATWNDWQEGTILEPSAEEGFKQLLKLQRSVLGYENQGPMELVVQEYNNIMAFTWQYCDNVYEVDKVSCGGVSPTEDTCVAAGCCWRESSGVGVPDCFQRAEEPECSCNHDLRNCTETPQDRLCCCTHAYPSPPPSGTPSTFPPPPPTPPPPQREGSLAAAVGAIALGSALTATILIGAAAIYGMVAGPVQRDTPPPKS